VCGLFASSGLGNFWEEEVGMCAWGVFLCGLVTDW
jgi:hypothetical protein